MEQPAKKSVIVLLTQVGWAAVVAFCLVGSMTVHATGAVYMLIIAALIWTAMRILSEGLRATSLLLERSASRPEKKDDGGPPPPTAAA